MGPLGVAHAREAYARGEWRTARDLLESERTAAPLTTGDLDLLWRASWWLGDAASSMSLGEELFRARQAEGDDVGASTVALDLSLAWVTEGDVVIGQAWLHRARRLLKDVETGPAHGYLRYLEAALALELEDDPQPVEAQVHELRELARRLGDDVLETFALVLTGMAAVWAGRTREGFADLDEAMLPVLEGAVPPRWSGDIYCTVIHVCHRLGDLARMRAWTDALDRWATPLSRTFMFAGVTRVRQLQLLSAEGEWDVVEREVAERSRALVGAHGWVAAEGFVELGDIRRRRGDTARARAAYARARALGVSPQPGEALIDEAEGRGADALAGLRAALAEQWRIGRAWLLLPTVEVALRAGELALAEQSGDELARTAALHDTPGLRAWADQAQAELLLHRGAWDRALEHLEAAETVYRAQRCPYAVARVHELVARVHQGRGEDAAAVAEVSTALAIYRRLGAEPDVARLAPRRPPGGLTEREVEVLGRVAAGASNRDVAADLVISAKTVSRHLANIYAKAGVSSRTAAAAWAREHGIPPVARSTTPAPNAP